MTTTPPEPSFTRTCVNLSPPSSRVIFATDEWFAAADNLLNPNPPVFDPAAFCAQGKVMDGWESRRRRLPGHDFCVVALGLPGVVHGLELDTYMFSGNYVPRFSVEVRMAGDK